MPTEEIQRALDARLATIEKEKQGIVPSIPDVITMASYGLGLWWCLGGPAWAAVASIIGDEVDGRLARATGTVSQRGAFLDWGADMTLVPLSLVRLGDEIGTPMVVAAAPLLLYGSAHWKANGLCGLEKPTVGSARAVIMLTTLGIQLAKR